MARLRLLRITLHMAISRMRNRQIITEACLRNANSAFIDRHREHPELGDFAFDAMTDEPPSGSPWEEVEVDFDDSGLRIVLGNLEELATDRLNAIQTAVTDCLTFQSADVANITNLFSTWMLSHVPVRVVGAGRALLAASVAANRLAHCGALVSMLGDKVPVPNSRLGGGIIAVSASGRTPSVLKIMSFAKKISRELKPQGIDIKIVGISDPDAPAVDKFLPFRELCSPGCFLPMRIRPPRPLLSALADLEELAIAELLDAMVVAAGLQIGVNFRAGHEDLVGDATGPHHQHFV